MNIKQIGIGLILADFVALTAYAIWQYGYAAFFDLATMNAITVQVSVKWALNKRLHDVNASKGWGLFHWVPGPMTWWIPRDMRTHDRR